MKNIDNHVFFGEPILAPSLVPVQHSATPVCIGLPFYAKGGWHRVTALSLGDPHGAVLVEDVEHLDVPSLGKALGTHRLFPRGANIVFLQAMDQGKIKARLWQKGRGEVAFTAQGACAAGIAAMMHRKMLNNAASVSMGGDTYRVEWKRGSGVKLS